MKEIKKQIKPNKLITRVVLYALIVMFFGYSRGYKVPQPIQFSIDLNQSTSKKLSDFDSPSFNKVFENFEEEEKEEEEEEDRFHSNSKSFIPLFLTLFFNEITDTSLFPHPRKVKLFILYHSWKSFLPI